MEQVIIGILSGDLDGASLLMLFIVGILTKRFVPWWVHEEVLEKLQEYEDASTPLLEEVASLIKALNEKGAINESRGVVEKQEELKHVIRRKRTTSPKRRTRTR